MFNSTTSSDDVSTLQAERELRQQQQPSEPNIQSDHADLEEIHDEIIDVTSIVQKIHSGTICTSDVPVELRRQCVGYLTMEGMSAADITQLMRISPRTVRRDRAAIRRDDAIMPDMHLGDELLGEYQRFVLAGIQRLTRRANDKSEPAYVRLWAEEAITRMYQRFIDTARKLNYLRDGQDRIRQQVALDPAEQKREVERFEAALTLSEAKNPIPRMQRRSEMLHLLKSLVGSGGKERSPADGVERCVEQGGTEMAKEAETEPAAKG